MSSASITTQSLILGHVECDSALVRGDGAGINSTLVLPLAIRLNPRAPGQAVAITELWGRAFLDDAGGTALGELTRAMSPDRTGLWSSHPGGTSDHRVNLRVSLTPVHLRLLEDTQPQERNIRLRLELNLAAALVGAEQRLEPTGGGPAVELSPLAWIHTEELRLAIPVADWAEKVLPALGADRFRTVLVSLPANGVLGSEKPLVRWFDDARARYDAGDSRGCIERCRDVRRGVETTLKATKNEPVSAKAAAARGACTNPAITAFLDGIWRALAEATNDAHHPEHTEPVYRPADARAVLLTTAVALEYLNAVFTPPPLR